MTDAAFAESADPFADDAEAEDARPSSLSERVLNQDEIDSLLGFDLGEADDASAPAFAPSSTLPSSATSGCPCSRSSLTALCG
jgi:hypothetical protein